jgi:5'-nucleotidase
MPRILVTNDDGVYAEGVRALASALERLGDVVIVAPLGDASAIGHALTLARPLRLERLEHLAPNIWAVDGTPTDCVNLAVTRVLDGLPDLVVSGINLGYNLGDDVTYSGTVAGAMEGTLVGVPSVAVSLCRQREPDFRQAASAAADVATAVLEQGLPPRTFLNVNVPARRAHGFRTTVQARRRQSTTVRQGEDPRGRKYYWIEEVQSDWDPDPRSDYEAIRAGWISVTPLQLDLTAREALEFVDALSLGASAGVE